MKGRPKNFAPVYITIVVVLFSVGLHALSRTLSERPRERASKTEFGGTEEWEARTYDARVKLGAALAPSRVAGGMATLFFDDIAFEQVNDGTVAPYYAPAQDINALTNFYPRLWPWPRFIHGQIARELAAQGAKAIGFDIMFPELRASCNEELVPTPEGKLLTPDEFLGACMKQASNVFLAVEDDKTVAAPLFLTNAAGLASIISKTDYSVLRRAKPFDIVRVWHPLVLARQKEVKFDLRKAKIEARKIVIPFLNSASDSKPTEIPLNPDGTMKLNSEGDIDFNDDPDEKGPETEFAFVDKRVWNLGLTLAAKALGLDLENPELKSSNLILHGPNGLTRTIPLDSAGYFYIDWSIRLDDVKFHKVPVYFGHLEEVLAEDKFRTAGGQTNDVLPFKDRIVVIGSIATGNNVSDRGGTPLESNTFLVTEHLNIANSIFTGKFVERTSLPIEALLIGVLGVIAAFVTWRLRILFASISICIFCVGYIGFSVWMYVSHRYWIPMVMPLGGGFLLPHLALVTYRVGFEHREQRRVRGIFSKLVSPDVVQELLGADRLAALSGARRTITVFFADVRGFTEFTDSTQQIAEEFVKKNNLSPERARDYYDRIAKEQLETVNVYLATIADTIKQHRGTLDKYMGDCVMAFWGAPIPNEEHALCCVRAAIDAQRALHRLNQQRGKENERRTRENTVLRKRGEAPLPPMPLLALGTGINTGSATVGLMGSDNHVLNFSVFGREVNLASRLEGVSGRGRIVIGESTFLELQKRAPDLAATCVPQPPVTPKGFRQPIPIYEVPWKLPEEPLQQPAKPAKDLTKTPTSGR